MNANLLKTLVLATFVLAAQAQAQGLPAMSPAWAEQMCRAWNADAALPRQLVESGWIRNDRGRGYKTMQIWRADCQNSGRIEMRIALKDERALCVYGGAAGAKPLDSGADYRMWAETPRWREMGAGEYGPMKAMMFKRLEFDGPKLEAMGNMGPFERFLRLVGEVPGDWVGCPP